MIINPSNEMNRLQEKLWKPAFLMMWLRANLKIRLANFEKFKLEEFKLGSQTHTRALLGCVFIALALFVPSSAVKPNPSAGTFEAWVNASSWAAANQTIFSAPFEGSAGSAGESYGGGGD